MLNITIRNKAVVAMLTKNYMSIAQIFFESISVLLVSRSLILFLIKDIVLWLEPR